MSQDYDVFSALDEFRNNDLLAEFKSTAASLSENKNDDEFNISDDSTLGNVSLSSKTTNETASESLESGTSKKTTNEIALESLESGTSKKKKTKSRKSKKTNQRFSMSPPPADLLPTTAKRMSPAKANTEQIASVAVEGRRQTRSMRQSVNAIKDQIVAVSQPVAEVQPMAQGRGRGRKKQTTPNIGAPARRAYQNPIARMFSRREYAAQLAAQSSNVDFVDLVSSPVPKINGVINVDSDTEETPNENSTSAANNSSFELSFDEENPELNIKVIWNGVPETFKLRKYQKFAPIFDIIAEREKADLKNLVFNLGNKIIDANDTPAGINYKIFEFIHGRVLVSKFTSPTEKKKRDTNKISLKIQSDQWKRPMQVELLKTESFKILYIKCAEELNIPRENLKLSFDGEHLELNGTPADLELEGGEAIDLRIKK